MSHRHERPKPLRRVRVKLTLEADEESLGSVSEKLKCSRISGGVLTAALADVSDPQQAADEVRRAGDALRSVFGQSRKEFK